MKCIIIYFSQTGNTEQIAKAIQAGIKQASCDCDLVPIKDANPKNLYNYDLIGLGSPIFGVEPVNVRNFINDMCFIGGKHAFVFNTHGAMPDHFFPSIVPKMKRRGLIVIGMRDWYGSCYLSAWPHPYPTDGHPDEIDLKKAKEFGKEMVTNSRHISAGETELIPPVPKKPTQPLPELPEIEGYKDYHFKTLEAAFRTFLKFHKEKCNYPKCRICMDNCPVYGIDLSVAPPLLARPCVNCEFCVKLCPTGALDGSDFTKYLASLKSEVFERDLEAPLIKAEQEGRFRRLIPVDKIGHNTPIYKIVGDNHPQWIIGKGLQKK